MDGSVKRFVANCCVIGRAKSRRLLWLVEQRTLTPPILAPNQSGGEKCNYLKCSQQFLSEWRFARFLRKLGGILTSGKSGVIKCAPRFSCATAHKCQANHCNMWHLWILLWTANWCFGPDTQCSADAIPAMESEDLDVIQWKDGWRYSRHLCLAIEGRICLILRAASERDTPTTRSDRCCGGERLLFSPSNKLSFFSLFIYLFISWSPFLFLSLSLHLLVQSWQQFVKKKKKKRVWETSLRDNPLFSSEDNSVLFHWRRKTNSAMVFKGSLFQLCVGCLIKCSFPLVVECASAFCRPVPQCLLQSTHMVCLSVYDFSYTGVVRFLNHLSTRGRAVHI